MHARYGLLGRLAGIAVLVAIAGAIVGMLLIRLAPAAIKRCQKLAHHKNVRVIFGFGAALVGAGAVFGLLGGDTTEGLVCLVIAVVIAVVALWCFLRFKPLTPDLEERIDGSSQRLGRPWI